MAKIKQILQGIFCVVVLAWLAAIPLDTQALPGAGGHTPSPAAVWIANVVTNPDIPETFELAGENDTFQLYADKTTLAFKVVDKRSGYIWSSNLDEVTPEDKLNKTWTAFARSGITIEYLDVQAVGKRQSITNSEHTLDMTFFDQGFEGLLTFTDVSITMKVIVKLELNGVSVEIPAESIKEESDEFTLGEIYVYPFFGATKADSVPGYMFIPDGPGTLIQFGATTKAQNMFYGRYYGIDLGMTTELPWDARVNRPYRISFPVTGMVHGVKENAFISIVEKGASYGEIQVHPAGIITQFNFMHNAFVYNESYFQATNRSGAGVTTLQPEINDFDIKIQFRFLTGEASDYVGMAKEYQVYLVETGMLKKVDDPGNDIAIKLEFLGGDKEKVLFWFRSIPMTTIDQMSEILRDLDVKNPEVVFYGWQPLGASTMAPKSLKIEKQLGSKGDLRSLVNEVTNAGGSFYLYMDPIAALYNEKGYSPRYDLAMSITNFNLIGYNRSKVNYYLNFNAVSERFSSLGEDVSAELSAGIALDNIGSMLYSDFKSGNLLNREEGIQKYKDMFEAEDVRTAFYMPNDYFFRNMEAYYDIPITNSGYIYTTEAVPFLQIALAGYVPYFGTALNFSSNMQLDLLRHVDYGVYPSFILTNDLTAKILYTGSYWIYTSSYKQWGADIEETYAWMNALLGPVKGQEIVAREVLEEGVVATTYSNGKQIIVNYTDETFDVGSVVVNARDAVLTEVNP